MARPIFVLGWGRSGTTWLSNLLIQHSAIAGVTHERGIHESAFFSCIDGRYGSLEVASNYVEFARTLAASYVFRQCGARQEFLYSQFPSTYAEVFRSVMDKFASHHNATHWLEKTPGHTLLAEKIAEEYVDARFIAIERNLADVLTSRLKLRQDGGNSFSSTGRLSWIAARVAIWHHYRNTVRKLVKRHPDRTYTLDYQDLKDDTESTMRRLCKFLDLDFQPSMLSSPFRANTSFKDNEPAENRAQVLSSTDKMWLAAWNIVIRAMPSLLIGGVYRLGTFLEKKRNLPGYFFRNLPDAPDALSTRL